MDVFKFKKDNFEGKEVTQLFQKYGKNVVRYARSILTKRKRNTKNKTLYDGLSYLTTYNSSDGSYTVSIDVAGASDYWAFVESGVKGRSRTLPNVGKNRNVLGLPQFSFKKKNLARGVVARWINAKPIRLRNNEGKFVQKNAKNMRSASFLIGRAIADRGLPYSGFLSTPIQTQNKTLDKELQDAYGVDLKNYFDYYLEQATK